MEKAKEAIVNVKVGAKKLHTNMMMYMAGVSPYTEKKESGDQLTQALGLMVLAVFLLFAFRKQLEGIFTKITTSVSTKLESLFPTTT